MRLVDAFRDLRQGWRLRGDAVAVRFADHAVERFAERLGRDDLDRVREDLSRMLGSATITAEPPPWVRDGHEVASAWLTLGDVTMPLRWDRVSGEWTAATTITSDSKPDVIREGEARRKAKQRGRRTAAKHGQKHARQRRPRMEPDAGEWDG